MAKGMRDVFYCILIIVCILAAVHVKGSIIGQKAVQQKVIDTSVEKDWNVLEGQYSVVYYKKNSEEAAMVMRAADAYFPMVAADFKWQRKEKPIFILYHEKKEMAVALGLDQSAKLPMGAYQGGRIVLLSPSLWAIGNSAQITDTFLEKGPVSHELVHFAMDDTVGKAYPSWLGEGVALYYEKKYTGFEWRSDLQWESSKLDPRALEANFQSLPPAVAYRKSYELVAAYVKIHGEKGLQEYIASLALY